VQSTFQIDVYTSDIAQIVTDVFRTMLGLEVEMTQAEWQAAPDRVTSVIHFAGDWRGAVLLECSAQQACMFTAKLMPIGQPSSMNDDVRDTLGEIGNMIGGNLKSVVPRGVGLSMPSVVEGSNYSMRICGGNLVNRLAFGGEAGNFWVTLVEMVEKESRSRG